MDIETQAIVRPIYKQIKPLVKWIRNEWELIPALLFPKNLKIDKQPIFFWITESAPALETLRLHHWVEEFESAY